MWVCLADRPLRRMGGFSASNLLHFSPFGTSFEYEARLSVRSSNPRVVMLAFGFPPEGNAGAYRPLRFVRRLASFGWISTVVAAAPGQYERFDPTLLERIPRETEVIRVKSQDLWQRFQSWRARGTAGSVQNDQHIDGPSDANRQHPTLRGRLRDLVRQAEARWYHPDMASPWINPAVDAVTRVCRRERVAVIWATAGPVSAFYAAQRASRKHNIPYVLDFRDSWTITHNDFEARRPAWAIRRDRNNMFQLLHQAQAVIFRYDREAECYWQAYRGALDTSKIYIIPNGYEAPIEAVAAPKGDRCTLLYAGVVSDYRYDTFLDALAVIKRTDPSRAQRLRVLFVGEGMSALAKDAEKVGVSEIVYIAGAKRADEVAALQREAHALLVFGRPASKPGYELFAGAKLFGSLKTGRPIIGVLPDDETRKVLEQVGCRTVADVESVPEICGLLCSLIDHWTEGTMSSLVPDPRACEAYSSERQTAILVRALEGVPAELPFIPGRQSLPPSLCKVLTHRGWLQGVGA